MDDNESMIPDDQLPYKRAAKQPQQRPSEDLASKARAAMPMLQGDIGEKLKLKREEERIAERPTELLPNSQKPQSQSPSGAFRTTSTGGVEYGTPSNVKRVPEIVSALRARFGLENVPTIDREIGGFFWTFRKPDFRDRLFAMSMSSTISGAGQEAEKELFDFGLVCSCIAAINNVPTWKAMEIELRPGERIDNPLFPPVNIRARTAGSLYDEISETMDDDLRARLIEAFQYEYRNKSVRSYLDFVKEGMKLFKCPTENCEYEIIDVVIEDPATGAVSPYYCKFHGCVMTMSERGDYPLR